MIFEKYNLEIPIKRSENTLPNEVMSNIENNDINQIDNNQTPIDNEETPFGGNQDFDGGNDNVEMPIDTQDNQFVDDTNFEGNDGNESNDEKKEIESLTGKIGQALRDYDKTKGVDDTLSKYVLNSILSAINTDEISDDVKNDLAKKLNL
jgi:hypothetical protein